MKKSIYTAFAALGLMGSAQAAAPLPACNNCEYARPVRWVGSYSAATPRGTFGNHDIVYDITQELGPGLGQNRQFDNHYVFDLEVNAQVSLTVTTKPGTALAPHWAVEIYADPGTTCEYLLCTLVFPDPNNAILSHEATTRWSGNTMLVAGRYMIRVAGGTRATGESAYDAKLAIKVMQ